MINPFKDSSEEDDGYFSMGKSGEVIQRSKDYVYNAGICEHPINKSQVALKLSTKRYVSFIFRCGINKQ